MKNSSNQSKNPVQWPEVSPTKMERLTKIQNALQTHGYLTYEQLATIIESSVSSARRGVRFLQERFNHPIEFNEEKNGWGYTEEVAPLPPMYISESEICALEFTKNAVKDLRGTSIHRHFISGFTKIVGAVTAKLSRTLRRWDEVISIHTRIQPILNAKIFSILARASVNREQLMIAYRKTGPGQIVEERIIDPQHLAKVDNDWYLFAYDHLRQEDRTFAPIRIKSLKRTGKKFVPSKTFSIEERLRDCFNIIGGNGNHHVIVRFNPHMADFIREKIWPCQQKMIDLENGGVELHLKVSSLEEVARWLMPWSRVQVVQPIELRKMVVTAARELIEENPV